MPRNLKLFVLFRILYNCRFYYPIYAILFLDLGLSLAQFSTLNFVWAVSIALFEVPSGALADRFGRRPLLVAAAVLMVVEMLIFCLAPIGTAAVFWFLLANRIASGLSEACASGADEALAYDSLPEEERETRWADFLPVAMRWVSCGFLISSIFGGVLYDADTVNRVIAWFGFEHRFAEGATIRFPLYLNLLTAIGTLAVAISFRESRISDPAAEDTPLWESLVQSFQETLRAGGWILRHRLVLGLILFGLLADGFIRLFYTVVSKFYRFLEISESWFGVISATATVIGIGCTFLMAPMAKRFSRRTNFGLVAAMIFAGLLALAFPLPGWWGVLGVAPLILSMRFLMFFQSQELNAVTESSRRATILSFRGLAYNLSYGGLSLLYGGLWKMQGADPDDSTAFEASLDWWPWAFGGLLLAGVLAFHLTRPKSRIGGV